MSLLIKALDHLEKSKQADKEKQQAAGVLTGAATEVAAVAEQALSLELLPITPENPAVENMALEEEAPRTAAQEMPRAESVSVDRELSLEEEAGLTSANFNASKYAKPSANAANVSTTHMSTSAIGASAPEAVKSTPLEINKLTHPKPPATPSPAIQTQEETQNQKAAARVFVANKPAKGPTSKAALLGLGVAGALIGWLGLQGYSYIKTLSAPSPMAAKQSLPINPQVNPQVVATAPTETTAPTEVTVPAIETQVQADSASAPQENAKENGSGAADNQADTAAFKANHAEKPTVMEDVIEAAPQKPAAKKSKNAASDTDAQDSGLSQTTEPSRGKSRKSVTLTKKAQAQGVDPTLMAAYQAYTRGEDASAQQQYRQVLQRDVRNVDALLGMAAIAQRQGRDADAQGWYQKVLEIEPRNSIAQSGLAAPQANADASSAESHIKNMLAQQPDSANLHAALGNVYAEQNQWASAQDSYFNASRLAPNNADYAFNVAISLDQMGKSNLALKQYQRALELLNKSGGASPDRAQLETRIRELQ